MATAWTPLANLTLGSSASSVTFSSISGSYRDLVLVIQASSTPSGTNIAIRMNSDTGSNYPAVYASGDGSGAYSGTLNETWMQVAYYSGATTSTFLSAVVTVADYSATDKHKTVLSRGGNSAQGTDMIAGRWANTSAVTTLSVHARTGGVSFATGSTFALYGVSA